MDKKDILIVLLMLALIMYIGIEQHNQMKTEFQQTTYMHGVTDGANETIIQVMQAVSTCQPIELTGAGRKIEIIAIQCLPKK